MAMKTVMHREDDFDGTPFGENDDDGETIEFSVRGKNYVIDLAAHNVTTFDSTWEPWIIAARISTATKAKPVRTSSPEKLKDVRDWARANGYTVSDRGRVKATILTAYDAATGGWTS